jgi:hypothetical protein
MTEVKRHAAPCPAEGCFGVIRIADDLPCGEYPCICHACRVALVWETTATGGRWPALARAPDLPGPDDPFEDEDLIGPEGEFGLDDFDGGEPIPLPLAVLTDDAPADRPVETVDTGWLT